MFMFLLKLGAAAWLLMIVFIIIVGICMKRLGDWFGGRKEDV
jgi:hypothetical protein